jgi:16S rRNA (cytosine967-C5)-methyltransferase
MEESNCNEASIFILATSGMSDLSNNTSAMSPSISVCSGRASVALPAALLKGMLSCLQQVVLEHEFADKAVANMLQEHTAWGSRDRKTSTRIVYHAVRNFLLYRQYVTEILPELPVEQLPEALLIISMLSDEVLAKRVQVDAGFWQPERLEAMKTERPALKYSLPDWLYWQILTDWGPQCAVLLETLDTPAPVYIRLNLVKGSEHQIYQQLSKEVELEKIPGFKAAYRLKGPNRLRQSKAFKEGLLEFQDIGSQFIGRACAPQAEQVLIDWCAGKGGKTLQLAQLMKDEGRVIASDIDESRLQVLQRRAKKSGLKSVEVMSKDQLRKYQPEADLILVDAPCSGTGTFRRQPDLKHRLLASQVAALPDIQLKLLQEAIQWLKPGGRLVYATCSMLKAENSGVIHSFLRAQNAINMTLTLLSETYLLPHELDSDGFYVAVLSKQG